MEADACVEIVMQCKIIKLSLVCMSGFKIIGLIIFDQTPGMQII